MLPLQGARVRSLVREVDPTCHLPSTAKKIKEERKEEGKNFYWASVWCQET